MCRMALGTKKFMGSSGSFVALWFKTLQVVMVHQAFVAVALGPWQMLACFS